MGRNNRRQQRLRERRDSAQDGATSAGRSGAPQGGRGGGSLARRPKPAWRQTLDSFGGFTVVGTIGISVLVIAALVWINRPGSTAGGGEFVPRDLPPTAGRTMGDPEAPIRLIEYADYQCPFCRRFWDETEHLLIDEYVRAGLVHFEHRDYAFLGPESVNAAKGASCAADQDAFWHFNDLLFMRQGRENSGVYSDANMRRYARELGEALPGFDVQAWTSCYDTDTYAAAVQQSTQSANAQGLSQTPSFLVNGQIVVGAQPIDTFRAMLNSMLTDLGIEPPTPSN